jgi:quercetin dioxygenase-like cupin family protein
MNPSPKGLVTEYRDILITRYDLKRGEKVPMHTHAPGYEHVTICAKGTVMVSFPGGETMQVLIAGELIDFAEHQQTHEIEGAADLSTVYNVQKKLDR